MWGGLLGPGSVNMLIMLHIHVFAAVPTTSSFLVSAGVVVSRSD